MNNVLRPSSATATTTASHFGTGFAKADRDAPRRGVLPLVAILTASLLQTIQALLPDVLVAVGALALIIQAAASIILGVVHIATGLMKGNRGLAWSGRPRPFRRLFDGLAVVVLLTLRVAVIALGLDAYPLLPLF